MGQRKTKLLLMSIEELLECSAEKLIEIGVSKIPLYNSEKFAFIDSIHFEVLSKHKWFLSAPENHMYAMTGIKSGKILGDRSMHRAILILKKELYGFDIGEHKDNYGLNNTSNNLRALSVSNNNRRANLKNSKRENKNICFKSDSPNRPYQVQIRFGKIIRHSAKKISIGCFATIEQAREARDKFLKDNNIPL